MKIKKITYLLVLCALILSMPVISNADSRGTLSTASGIQPTITHNVMQNNYDRWASPINSHLVFDENGFLRIERGNNNSKTLIIETYDNNLNCIKKTTLKIPLPLWGGFFAGKDAYYVVSGTTNKDQSDSNEVIRVEKYDKAFKKVGSTSVSGINTTVPFDAGTLSMAEAEGRLYIKTSHEMYKSSDGHNHQANLYIKIKEDDMKLEGTAHKVFNSSTGYVSHSFNQFIIADKENHIVSADHGDAHPRGMIIFKSKSPASSDNVADKKSSLEFFKINGSVGNNLTNCNLGGLEERNNGYIAAGASVKMDNRWHNRFTKNVFVSIIDKNLSTSKIIWLTNSPENNTTVGTPHLIKFNDNKFLVLWDIITGNEYSNKIAYAIIDSTGNIISKVKTASGMTSDCKPVVKDGKAIWYITNSDSLKFISIDENGIYEILQVHLRKVLNLWMSNKTKGIGINWYENPDADKYTIYKKIGNNGSWKKLTTVSNKKLRFVDEKVKKGTKYSYKIQASYKNNTSPMSKIKSIIRK